MHSLLGVDLTVAAAAFAPLLLLELPDKTFVATLVLSARYPPLLAWTGVAAAFGVQCLLAVTVGGLLAQLPTRPVVAAAAVLFAGAAVVLWRGAGKTATDQAEAQSGLSGRVRAGATGLRAVGASFLVVFIAEWGDLSQLFTAGLAARYADPVSVFLGAWAALLVVSGLAAVLGTVLLARVSLPAIRRSAAGVCAVLAVLAAAEAAGLTR